MFILSSYSLGTTFHMADCWVMGMQMLFIKITWSSDDVRTRNCRRTDAFTYWTAASFKYRYIPLSNCIYVHICRCINALLYQKNEYKSNYCWRADGRKKLTILTVRGRVNERLRVRSKPYHMIAGCQAGEGGALKIWMLNYLLTCMCVFFYNDWSIHNWRYFCTI